MITGYSEVMRDIPGENTPENIQIIIDEATRLTTLVNDVLDLSKLQSGTLDLAPEKFNLTESIEAVSYTHLGIAQNNQICIIVADSLGNQIYSEDATPRCKIHWLSNWDLAVILRNPLQARLNVRVLNVLRNVLRGGLNLIYFDGADVYKRQVHRGRHFDGDGKSAQRYAGK